MRRLETSHEKAFMRWLEKYARWEAIKIYKRGWPDRLILGPGPAFFFIEFKRDADEDLRKLQDHIKQFLTLLGFKVYVCRSGEEAKEKVRRHF